MMGSGVPVWQKSNSWWFGTCIECWTSSKCWICWITDPGHSAHYKNLAWWWKQIEGQGDGEDEWASKRDWWRMQCPVQTAKLI